MIKSRLKKCILAIYGLVLTLSGVQAKATLLQDTKSNEGDSAKSTPLFNVDLAKENAMMEQIMNNVTAGNFKLFSKDSPIVQGHDHSGKETGG